jgi:hypothetical protein
MEEMFSGPFYILRQSLRRQMIPIDAGLINWKTASGSLGYAAEQLPVLAVNRADR